MTTLDAPPARGVASVQQEVLAKLVEPGVDVAAARQRFELQRGRRRRTRRVLAGSTAVLLLAVAGTALLLSRDTDPDSVLADRDEQVDTSTTTSVAEVVADIVVAVPETVPVTSVAPTTVVTQPPVTAPTETTPTTLPPNQPLIASLAVLTPTVEAGATASVAVSWSDPDLGAGAGAPRHTASWGDPLVSTPVDTSPRAACDTPGPPGAGTDTLRFRYSTPGRYTVRVVVETCGGQGAYAERAVLDGVVTVTSPRFVDASNPELSTEGQSLVVFQAPLASGGLWPALELATIDYVPTTDPTPVPLAGGEAVPVFTTSGPATILVLPAQATGTVRVRWSTLAVCAATTGTDLAGPAGEVLALPLSVVSC